MRNWTPEAADVLSRACDHYGGFQNWRTIRRIRLVPERLSGLLPWLKGSGKTFRLPSAFEIEPHDRRTRFVNYPDDEHTGVFENGSVRIEHPVTGGVVIATANHRRSFDGLGGYRRWTPVDALYFFGYALAHYHSLPFTLGDARLIEMVPASRRYPVDVIDVELPAGLHTHCRRQSFHIDQAGRIARHDYHAEVAGAFARGAHFWRRETVVNGFPICLERHVSARVGHTPIPLTALHAVFATAQVERRR